MACQRRYHVHGLFAFLATPYLARGALGPLVPRQTTAPEVTAVSECHLHESTQFCMVGTTEYRIPETVTVTADLPSSYTDCHSHGTQTWCVAGADEVQIVLAAETATATVTTAVETGSPTSLTAVSECHLHGSDLYCMAGTTEYHAQTTVTATADVPATFTSCHTHDAETYCLSPSGDDVEMVLESDEEATESTSTASSSSGQSCHFHAGVEHCVGSSESESSTTSCERVDRDYNIPLRIGLVFVILATSSIGVFTPILLSSFIPPRHVILCILRQFGTGVIVSTAFIHLLTHAHLMFESDCLGELAYEGTAAAILMAGLFLSFLAEYAGSRVVQWQAAKKTADMESASTPEALRSLEMVKVAVLEAGIIFHSLLIGITLVVSGDSFFLTLFAVIIFHQMFEGVALGTRIAALGHASLQGGGGVPAADSTSPSTPPAAPVSTAKKLAMASAFALVTPVGMAIGIGVLHRFNGNDPSTRIALGTLDALSAGILAWVGVVEMWAEDWMRGGELTAAGPVRTLLGLASLAAGMVLMSVLGKWA